MPATSRCLVPLLFALLLLAGCGRKPPEDDKKPRIDGDGGSRSIGLSEEGGGKDDGSAGEGRKFALLVGVRSYDHDSLSELAFTENDVEELAEVLSDRERGNFTRVKVLSSSRGAKDASARPTAANFRKELKAVLDNVKRHDLVLVGLAGHGLQLRVEGPRSKAEREESFFCTADAKPRDTRDLAELSRTMVPLGELFKELEQSGAGVKLMLVDACRNEPRLGRKMDADHLPRPPRGTAALFSCKGGEMAYESRKLGKGHGVFFHHVIQGLKGEAKNSKGSVTWSRLVDYVVDGVGEAVPKVIGGGARQTPHEIKNLEGSSPVLVAAPAPKPADKAAKDKDGGTAAPPDEKGWVQLFNGKDLEGWRPRKPGQEKAWSVEDGVLVGESDREGYLMSATEHYQNFHLRARVMINAGGNSGIFFRTSGGKQTVVPNGYEAQIHLPTSEKKINLTGSLMIVPASGRPPFALSTPLHNANEWFDMEVVAVSRKITIKVNGKEAGTWTDASETYRKGGLALQIRPPKTLVRFKKIEIKELPVEKE